MLNSMEKRELRECINLLEVASNTDDVSKQQQLHTIIMQKLRRIHDGAYSRNIRQ